MLTRVVLLSGQTVKKPKPPAFFPFTAGRNVVQFTGAILGEYCIYDYAVSHVGSFRRRLRGVIPGMVWTITVSRLVRPAQALKSRLPPSWLCPSDAGPACGMR